MACPNYSFMSVRKGKLTHFIKNNLCEILQTGMPLYIIMEPKLGGFSKVKPSPCTKITSCRRKYIDYLRQQHNLPRPTRNDINFSTNKSIKVWLKIYQLTINKNDAFHAVFLSIALITKRLRLATGNVVHFHYRRVNLFWSAFLFYVFFFCALYFQER